MSPIGGKAQCLQLSVEAAFALGRDGVLLCSDLTFPAVHWSRSPQSLLKQNPPPPARHSSHFRPLLPPRTEQSTLLG